MNLKRNLYVALLLFALPFNAQLAFSQELIFSHIDGSPIHARGAKVLKELYGRLGIDVGFLELPGRRALKMSNNGETDGEILRIWEVGVTHQNLLRVPTPLLTLHGFAFTNTAPAIDDFQQLDMVPRIGIQRGVVWAENAVGHRKGVVRVTTVTELADKLAKGAIDVALSTEDGINWKFDKRNSTEPFYHGAPIISFKVYHYLHKKHEDLIAKVDVEIKKMSKNKEIEKIANFPFHNIN